MASNIDDDIPELPDNDPPESPPPLPRTSRNTGRSSRATQAQDDDPVRSRSRPRVYPSTFLETVRSETSYATLRRVVGLVTLLSIALFAIAILICLGNFERMSRTGHAADAVAFLILFVLGIILTIAGKQATILFVDIADILIWKGKRQMRNER